MTVVERFLEYTKIHTTSDELSESTPSTKRQFDLAKKLVCEMKEIGLSDVSLDEKGYVYGFLPASKGCENLPCIGLIAHMDTSPDTSGENVKPHKVICNGEDVDIGNGVHLTKKGFPFIEALKGEELIVTDGTTLLGGDDKAGIAEIISTVEYFAKNPDVKHGKIAVAFTPDEEIGRGADHFDIEKFSAKWAYTVDGGELGEIEDENFNAAGAEITVHGINMHPGYAKDKMKNAVLIASELVSMLPPAETPSHTEGYEGFYHVAGISGDETNAKIGMIIRDHDLEKFTARKSFVAKLCEYMNFKYGEGTVALNMTDSYYNMKEKIKPFPHIVENAESAMKKCGVVPKVVAIRGGTDGSRLSYEGLPCPNLSTGVYNMHSVYEFVPTKSLEKMVQVLIQLLKYEAE